MPNPFFKPDLAIRGRKSCNPSSYPMNLGSTQRKTDTRALNFAATATLAFVCFLRSSNEIGNLDWEESFAVGQALTLDWTVVFRPNTYLIITQRLLIEVALWFPLEVLPFVTVTLSVAFWTLCLATIYYSLQSLQVSLARSYLATLAVALVPGPLAISHGLIMGSWWIQLFAAVVLVSSLTDQDSRHHRIYRNCFLLLTSVSHPFAFVLVLGLLIRYRMRSIGRGTLTETVGCVSIGLILNLISFANRKPLLDYFEPSWMPNTVDERKAMIFFDASGATSTRDVVVRSLVDRVAQIPEIVKFYASSFLPNPVRSWIQGPQSWLIDGLLLVAFCTAIMLLLTPLARIQVHRRSQISKFEIPLFVMSAAVTGTSALVVDDPLQHQYFVLAISATVLACCLNVCFGAGQTAINKVITGLALVISSLCFAPNVGQQFIDEGRNRAGYGWSIGLSRTVEHCDGEDADEVVVIMQDREISNPAAPVLVTCGAISR